MRRAILQLIFGPQSFQKAVLEPGTCLLIGRADPSNFLIRFDKSFGTTQVELSWDGTSGRVQVMPPQEALLLNGQSVNEGRIDHGDWFRCGDSTFMLFAERKTPPAAPLDLSTEPRWQRVLTKLRSAPGNLYALLDAARDKRVLELLRESPDEARSLYEGAKGDAIADVAPYLVGLTREGWLCEALVREGWRRSWGLFLNSPAHFKEVRRHFRRLLRVQEEGTEPYLYFRFYDPRVLRSFLPICSAEQLDALFGPISGFFMEDPSGEVIHALPRAGAVARPDVDSDADLDE